MGRRVVALCKKDDLPEDSILEMMCQAVPTAVGKCTIIAVTVYSFRTMNWGPADPGFY